jgi:acid phosphatase
LSIRGGDEAPRKKYRAIQVQILHRHGDRTPITPLTHEDFWASTLVAPDLLAKIEEGTNCIRREALVHKAHGRGPFGKLTQLGLFQMIDVGTTLREELCSDSDSDSDCDFKPDANGDLYHSSLWNPSRPLHSKDIRILCTDFPRTIQSVQGLLVGFFPDGLEETIEIDCSHTSWMIPDPQPRRNQEQEELEAQLASRPHMLEREADMLPLAIRCTDAVRHMLGEGAFGMAFGIGEDNNSNQPDEGRVLPWAQLAEITKCLQVRNLLPESITAEDQEALSAHCAWRWFESLHHPRLSYLAMHKFTHTILHSMNHHDTEPILTIYSAHDSSLIALMCAFRLEQPSVWPEYGSYLKMELLEVTSADQGEGEEEYVVRFYLNGSLLRSQWHGELREEISLSKLSHYISTEGAVKAS